MKILKGIEDWFDQGMPLTFELKVSILLIFTAAVAVTFVFLAQEEKTVTPCMPEGNPGRCYHFTEEMCQVVWDKATETCDSFIQSLDLKPGRLIGPIQFKCRLMHLDRAFYYNRKSSAECDHMFADLQDWKRRNEFSP